MKKIIIGIFFASLISLFQTSMAWNVLYGKIRSDKWKGNGYRASGQHSDNSCNIFPAKQYDFYPVSVFDLKYDGRVPYENRVKDLRAFVVTPSAAMTLVSFDKKTGISRFKLTLTGGDWLSYRGGLSFKDIGPMLETGGTVLDFGHSLKLASGENTEFIIEGKLETVNGKAHWVSFNRNPYFDIEVKTFFDCKNEVSLIRLKDIPVVVTT